MDIYEYSTPRKRFRNTTLEFLPDQFYNRPHGFNMGVLMEGLYSEINEVYKGENTNLSYYTEYDSLWQIIDLDTIDYSEPYSEKPISIGSGSKGIVLFMNFSRPFGWHWQLTTGASIRFNKEDSTNFHILGDGISTQPFVNDYGYYSCKRVGRGVSTRFNPRSASIYLQLQYFLNSRTRIEFTQKTEFSEVLNHRITTNYTWNDSDYVRINIPYDEQYRLLDINTGMSGIYYFTPKMFINCSGSFYQYKIWNRNYSSDHEQFDLLNIIRSESKYNHFIFSISLNYYIL